MFSVDNHLIAIIPLVLFRIYGLWPSTRKNFVAGIASVERSRESTL